MIFAVIVTVLLSLLYHSADSYLPTFSPENKDICDGFGFNWAAEIRCLREVINQCENEGMEKRRGSRSLQQSIHTKTTLPLDSSSLDSVEYGNPYSYPRPYSRTYYQHSINPIRPPSPAPNNQKAVCDCKEDIAKFEVKFEKKLYEVKMKAQHDTEKEVGLLRKQFETDLRGYERITTKDIIEIKRHLDYIQAPRITNNDMEYFLIKREESWYTASEKCIGYGAHLASIHGKLENGLVTRLIPANQTAWIGVNDIQKENVFKNSDGSAVDFQKWAQKQPNNEEHNENCVEVDHNGQWNDKLCIITRPFVCKRKID